MRAIHELLSTDAGLMTVVGLTFMMGMGVFFVRYFLRHMEMDAEAAKRAKR
ncbi:MAG: DUF3149 domain-containing protein [Ideonella sp.]|jgi:hypothetical protein|nr:DUF3149 domain-containing protein [Ideonella sp.]MBL0149160.1 DUF3149 domain-containing protein [Ideonella sp.]